MTQFRTLTASTLPGQARLAQDGDIPTAAVVLDAPALSVMTDLTRVPAVSVTPDTGVEDANLLMAQRRVRMLFVVDEKDSVIGLITTNDILGEKPMQIVRSRGVTHAEVSVRDIMTPGDRVEVLDMAEVRQARIGDLVETLRESGRQHALAMRVGKEGMPEICGVFSAADLSRRLGAPVVPVAVPRTFAEIEETIARE